MSNLNGKNVVLMVIFPKNGSLMPMGCLYNAIEYFIEIYRHNPDIHLVLYKSHRFTASVTKIIRDIIEFRYDISDYSFMDNVVVVDNLTILLLHNKFNKILSMCSSTHKAFKVSPVRANKVIIIPGYTDKEHYYQSDTIDVKYYSEMPFCKHDVPYKMKMLFNSFRSFESYENNLYVNHPYSDISKNKYAMRVLESFDKPRLVKNDKFIYDLHRHFNEYVYIKSDVWFDPSPRLFHESKFYGKPYHYFNECGVKDGSWYRYYGSLDENISDRDLSGDDEIVQLMSD